MHVTVDAAGRNVAEDDAVGIHDHRRAEFARRARLRRDEHRERELTLLGDPGRGRIKNLSHAHLPDSCLSSGCFFEIATAVSSRTPARTSVAGRSLGT